MSRFLAFALAALLFDRACARLALHTLSTPDAVVSIALIAACVLHTAGAWAPVERAVWRRGRRS